MPVTGAVGPRTPVLVGVGQFTERLDDPGYRGMSSVDLATAAALADFEDAVRRAFDPTETAVLETALTRPGGAK